MDTGDVLLAYITRFNLNAKKLWLRPHYAFSRITRWKIHVPKPQFRGIRWQGLDHTWIAARLELMQRFLIPSLAAQTDQEFVWLVLVHPDTPDAVLTRIRQIPQCRILKTEAEVTHSALIATQSVNYLCDHFDHKGLVSVRIDSDDAVNPTHASRLKDIAVTHQLRDDGYFTDFPDGIFFNLSTGRGQLKQVASRSCGISRIELLNRNAGTIYCGNHTQISRRPDCISFHTDEPMWVQTTHDFHINRPNKKLPTYRRQPGSDLDTEMIVKYFPSLDFGE